MKKSVKKEAEENPLYHDTWMLLKKSQRCSVESLNCPCSMSGGSSR